MNNGPLNPDPSPLDDQSSTSVSNAFGSLQHDASNLTPPGPPSSGGGVTTALPLVLLFLLVAGVGAFLAQRGDDAQSVASSTASTSAETSVTLPVAETPDGGTPSDEVPSSDTSVATTPPTVAMPDGPAPTTATTQPAVDADPAAVTTSTPDTEAAPTTTSTTVIGTATTSAPGSTSTTGAEPTPQTTPTTEADPTPAVSTTTEADPTPAVTTTTEADPTPAPTPGSNETIAMAVVGVDADDWLNARSEPGTDAEPLGTISPFSTSITRYVSEETVIGGSRWVLIGNPDARDFDAWVNARFLTEITGDSDQPRSFYNAVSDVREALSRDNAEQRLADVLTTSGAGSVVISADGFFDDEDQRLGANELAGQNSPTPTIVRWGTEGGSDNPIDATVEQFFDALSTTAALTETEKVAVNQRIHSGNMIDNAAGYFPGATVVELHYGGDDGDLEAFTWDTIRLVFQPAAGDNWHLVGIAHDTWEI